MDDTDVKIVAFRTNIADTRRGLAEEAVLVVEHAVLRIEKTLEEMRDGQFLTLLSAIRNNVIILRNSPGQITLR